MSPRSATRRQGTLTKRIGEPALRPVPRIFFVGGFVVVAAAVLAGLATSSGDRDAILLPAAGAVGLAVAALAASRFDLFVALVLLIRASLDVAKFGSSSLDATGGLSLLFIGASVLWLLAQRSEMRGPEQHRASRTVTALVLLFGAALASVPSSSHPLQSALEAVRLGTLIVIMIVLVRLISDQRRLRLILIAVLASSLLPLVFAARQLTSGGGLVNPDGLSRIRGTFQHPNPFAAYLFLLITLIVALYPHVRARYRLLLLPLGLACGGALISTYARGAWAAMIASLIVIALVQDRRLFGGLIASIIVVAVAVPSVGTRLADITQTQSDRGAPGNSLVWRLQYWQQVIGLQETPAIGIGLKEVELGQETAVLPHNDPIRVYVELGLVGLVAYVWLVWTMAVEARYLLRRAPPGIARGLAVAFSASLAGIIVLSLSANVITQLVILWYFMAILAMAVAATRSAESAVEMERAPGAALTTT